MSDTNGGRSTGPQDSNSAISRDHYDAVLLDLDGVITDTASVHAACWKQMFDEYLQKRAAERGEAFRPFDIGTDYRLYVDGKPRYDGVRDFLESRGIQLPQGSPDDSAQAETVDGLGNRKNELVNKVIEEKGVDPYDGSVELIRQLRHREFKIAVQNRRRHFEPELHSGFKGSQVGPFFRRTGRRQRNPCRTPGRKTCPGQLFDGGKAARRRARASDCHRGRPLGSGGRPQRKLRACDRRRAEGECRGTSAPWSGSGGERPGRTGELIIAPPYLGRKSI
jgi:phosphoglycolate phosphatase-like HAD superfamily hydrolase